MGGWLGGVGEGEPLVETPGSELADRSLVVALESLEEGEDLGERESTWWRCLWEREAREIVMRSLMWTRGRRRSGVAELATDWEAKRSARAGPCFERKSANSSGCSLRRSLSARSRAGWP